MPTPTLHDPELCQALLRRLEDLLDASVHLGDDVSQVAARLRDIQQQLEEMDVSIAVGIAACDAAHRTYKELKAEADAAMYKDKMKCYARHGWEPRA